MTTLTTESVAEEYARLMAENAQLREALLIRQAGHVECFDHQRPGYVVQHNTMMGVQLPECGCTMYEDVLTLRRWNAYGFRVRKGEHAVIRSGAREQFALFCRCQISRVGPEPVANTFADGDTIPGFEG